MRNPIGKMLISVDDDGHETWLYQFEELPKVIDKDAPIGTRVCDSLSNVWIKVGEGKKDWKKSTNRIMIMDVLDWPFDFLSFDEKSRKELKKVALEGVKSFKKGKISQDGEKLVEMLHNECEFIGVTPNISYMMCEEKEQGSLDVIWQHPFSKTTLLYKHKDYPLLFLTNGNISYDDTVLNKNPFNDDDTPVGGITG